MLLLRMSFSKKKGNKAERVTCLKVTVFEPQASVPLDTLQQRAAVATHKHTNYV